MKKNKNIIGLLVLLLTSTTGNACTGIRIIAKDGTVIYARTLEFSQNLDSEILFVPRNYTFSGETPYKNISGLTWQAKYAVLGANALHVTAFVDGINEKGLAGGIFYFPEYASYEEVTPQTAPHSIASWQVLTWILTTCATINEVKEKLPAILVSNAAIEGATQPVHYIIHDPQGKSLVIEYTKNQLQFHDNPLGVITNSPDFEWHITNLRNYINLSAVNVPKIKLSDISLTPFGQGSGMLGLPGDFTPPSRFVRAIAFSQSVFTPLAGQDALSTAFHILNLFNIPKGVVRTTDKESDSTEWTSAANLSTKQYYFHTYDNRQIFMIDLTRLEKRTEKLTIPMQQEPAIIDLTPTTSASPQDNDNEVDYND